MLKKLISLAFVAFAVAVAVPSSRARVLEKAQPLMDGFKAKIVPGRLEAMTTQLVARVNRGEGLPANWEGWLERDYSSSAEDPWGHYYYFETRRGGFLVGSMGPDGRRGTEDDITREQRLQ